VRGGHQRLGREAQRGEVSQSIAGSIAGRRQRAQPGLSGGVVNEHVNVRPEHTTPEKKVQSTRSTDHSSSQLEGVDKGAMTQSGRTLEAASKEEEAGGPSPNAKGEGARISENDGVSSSSSRIARGQGEEDVRKRPGQRRAGVQVGDQAVEVSDRAQSTGGRAAKKTPVQTTEGTNTTVQGRKKRADARENVRNASTAASNGPKQLEGK